MAIAAAQVPRSTRTAITCVCALAVAVCAHPQTRDDQRESLHGLSGAQIIVEGLHPDAERIGLNREDLQREAGYRLKRADIPSLTSEERDAEDRQPYLYINCNVLYVEEIELTTFSIDVELHQTVTLASGQSLAAITWTRSYLGVQRRDRAAGTIRAQLGQLIEHFIVDYSAANRNEPDEKDD